MFETIEQWRAHQRQIKSISVNRVYVKIAGGWIAGAILSRLDYFESPTNDGSKPRRAGIERNGFYWVVKESSVWEKDLYMTPGEFDGGVNALRSEGLVIVETHYFNKKKALYLRINRETFMARLNDALASDEPKPAPKRQPRTKTQNNASTKEQNNDLSKTQDYVSVDTNALNNAQVETKTLNNAVKISIFSSGSSSSEDIAADAAPPQKPVSPSKKRTTSRQTPIQSEAVIVPPPPVAPEQAAADLDMFNALESASGRELPPPTGTSKDAIERALVLACVPSGERREVTALMGQIRKAGLIIREGDICTADDIMARCVGYGSLFYTTHFAESEDGLTKPPTPMTIATWIWKLEECRSRKFKSVRAPIDYDQALADAEARAARQRELHDTPSPFPTLIPAWQVLNTPRKTA